MKAQFPLYLSVAVLAGAIGFAIARVEPVKDEIIERIETALPDTAPAKPGAPRKVLVFTKTNGFRHDSIPAGVEALTRLGKKTGAFEATHSEDDAMFEPDALEKFDGVIMLNTTGEIFRPHPLPEEEAAKAAALAREERLKKSLVNFVESGKGLAGIHSATDTYKHWDAYNDMMGGAFVNHPWHELVPVKNLDPSNPVNAVLKGENFEINDEIYQFRNGTASAEERRMLLALNGDEMDLSKGEREDGLYPISWIDTYGKGRIYYCSLGHRDEIYWNPTILKHYLAGIQFALGDLEAETKPQ